MSNLIDYIKGQLDGSFWVLIHAHSKIILEKLNKISETTKQLTLNDIKEARVFNANDELKIFGNALTVDEVKGLFNSK